MGLTGVSGTAIGEHRGKPCLKVYLSDTRVRERIPDSLRGFPILIEISGPFRSL